MFAMMVFMESGDEGDDRVVWHIQGHVRADADHPFVFGRNQILEDRQNFLRGKKMGDESGPDGAQAGPEATHTVYIGSGDVKEKPGESVFLPPVFPPALIPPYFPF
jgi:hypothetical protein